MHLSPTRAAAAAIAAIGLALVPTLSASVASASTSSPGFSQPGAIAISGNNAFVANFNNNSVTEFNTQTGAQVRLLHDKSYGFA